MPSPTILVTIRGPLETTDLELPGDVPVSELIPFVLEMCGSPKNSSQAPLRTAMSLRVEGTRAPLSLNRTLIDVDVYDGTVLLLQMEHTPSPQVEHLPPQGFLPSSVHPSAHTGGIGVTWETLR